MNHTPGPWEWVTDDILTSAGGWRVLGASCSEGRFASIEHHWNAEQAIANARLIAAAPDLFQLVLSAASDMESGDEPGSNSQWFKEAKAVLARIEGKEQA